MHFSSRFPRHDDDDNNNNNIIDDDGRDRFRSGTSR